MRSVGTASRKMNRDPICRSAGANARLWRVCRLVTRAVSSLDSPSLRKTPCEVSMRRSSVALLGLGLVLVLACDQSSPPAPAETAPSLAKHEILHIDDRS